VLLKLVPLHHSPTQLSRGCRLYLYNRQSCARLLVFGTKLSFASVVMAAPIASMSTAAAPPSHLNGAGAVSAEVLREAEFLQKILQIRDEVLASKHPRIYLPPKVIEQVAPRLPQTASSRPTTNGTSNGSSSQLFPPRPASSTRPPTSPIPPTQRPYSAKSSSSSIDPILLTKSEHLVKAEQQLKRQQIERALKDQFDKKGRGNDADEREALIDVEQCLIKAHQLVPPVSGLPSPTNNSDDVESFDENSYYSSKANSWSSEDVDHADHAHADVAPLTSQAQPAAQHVNVHSRPAEPTVIDLDEEAYEPADDIEIYEPEPAQLHEDGEEEEDYSPPPAEIGPSEPLRGRQRNRHGGTNGYDTKELSYLLIPTFFLFACRITSLVFTTPAAAYLFRFSHDCMVASVAILWTISSAALRPVMAVLACLSSLPHLFISSQSSSY
jgi:hypothetical protein